MVTTSRAPTPSARKPASGCSRRLWRSVPGSRSTCSATSSSRSRPSRRSSSERCTRSRSPALRERRPLMRADMVPGAVFPDYALADHTDTVRTLSDIQGDDAMVLTLARGNYCPKEHQQHLELAAHQAKFAVAYTGLV